MLAVLIGALFTGVALAAPEPLLRAIELPSIADQLRTDGVDDAQVREALMAARDTQLSAGEAREALEVADVEVRKHGPLAAFGDFLARELHLGKRGKALETAIRDEHRAHGNGSTLPVQRKRKVTAHVSPQMAVPVLDEKTMKREERRLKREKRAEERASRRGERRARKAP
jgi:hypothetical protein